MTPSGFRALQVGGVVYEGGCAVHVAPLIVCESCGAAVENFHTAIDAHDLFHKKMDLVWREHTKP